MNASVSVSLKADLLRPEAYAPLRPARVELAETHVSQVFLIEGHVFKVKRPVDLGFLDFTTIAAREQACRAEVALNARLAPDVYRGVVPVRRGADGHATLSGDGPVVDWAVHMRRLPDARRADSMLARGELGGGAIDAIAGRLARFHDAARTAAEVATFGSPGAIARNVEENVAQTADAISTYAAAEGPELVRWQTDFLREHRDLFLRRAEAGHVRDGHGDLRLEHVYLGVDLQGGGDTAPTIIDCIEFSDRFRFADVCADVAFLSMDLEAHGRVDLAERLLARYARDANDFDLYALVDFYESYRALVRAKVSAILAADPDVDVETRARATKDARLHFVLALSADRVSLLRPAVVAVGGLIASGKSTIAAHLGDEMSAPVIDADRTRKAMVGVEAHRPLKESAWAGAYDPEFTERVYAEVFRRATVVLDSGRPVILDASFRSPGMRLAAQDLARSRRIPFRFVECHADEGVCRARLSERERIVSVSDGRLAIFDAFRARFEPVGELSLAEHIVLDTTLPLEASLRTLRAHVETWPVGFVA